jgi:putative SOS response-associated peptidase YedK
MILLTHTIIKTTVNDLVKPIQPTRMPVILDPENYEAYLHGTAQEALALLRPYPAERMQIVREGIGELRDALP